MWIPGFGDWKRQTWHSIWFKAARLTSFFAMLDCILFIARKSRITRRVLQRFESMVEYVSCFIWDHIAPRATGCIVFGCMEGKTKNPTSNNSDKRWETGAQFLFCCLAFCCLMFLEFSQWHVFWKTDITRIFQIACAQQLNGPPFASREFRLRPTAHHSSLGLVTVLWKTGRSWEELEKPSNRNRSDSEPSCQLQYVYSIDKWRSWKQSHLPIKICANPAQKHLQSILKSLEYETQIMATRFFYQDTRTKDKSIWKVCGGDFSTGFLSFFHFNSPMMK